MRVVLTYLDGVSNWGPKDASGLMEVVLQEGEVRLSGRGLSGAPGQHYVLWLAREGSTDVFRLGEPKPRPDGTLVLDLVLPGDVPNRDWNLALLTVEDSATPARPGPRHSIAGRFPQLPANGSETIPSNLPNTGLGGGASSSASSIFVAAGIAAAFAILVCALALRGSARRGGAVESGQVRGRAERPLPRSLPGAGREAPDGDRAPVPRQPAKHDSGIGHRTPVPSSSPRDGERLGERLS